MGTRKLCVLAVVACGDQFDLRSSSASSAFSRSRTSRVTRTRASLSSPLAASSEPALLFLRSLRWSLSHNRMEVAARAMPVS